MFVLEKAEQYKKKIGTELLQCSIFTCEMYEIKISTGFGNTEIDLTGLRDSGQPKVQIVLGKTFNLKISDTYQFKEVDTLIQDIKIAKSLAEYVIEHLQELI